MGVYVVAGRRQPVCQPGGAYRAVCRRLDLQADPVEHLPVPAGSERHDRRPERSVDDDDDRDRRLRGPPRVAEFRPSRGRDDGQPVEWFTARLAARQHSTRIEQ